MPHAKKATPTFIPSLTKATPKSKTIQSVARLAKSSSPAKLKPVAIKPKIEQRPAITKAERILAHLRLPQGASLVELQAVIGWQAHSVRGFLSGIVRKRLGLVLQVSITETGERRYRIAEGV